MGNTSARLQSFSRTAFGSKLKGEKKESTSSFIFTLWWSEGGGGEGKKGERRRGRKGRVGGMRDGGSEGKGMWRQAIQL